MSDVNLTRSARPPALVRPGGVPGHNRTLLNANRQAMLLLGMSMDATGDPKGRILREWRLQLGIDPSLLATQACMSLSQLYELEDGGHSRFYSDSLRRQAARRVARLLGLDWDRIEAKDQGAQPSISNVVALQRTPVTVNGVLAAAAMAPPAMDADVPLATPLGTPPPAVAAEQAIPMGLAAPASETLLVEPPGGQFTSSAKASPQPSSSGWSTLLALLLVVVAGAAAGYGFAEYSPYRLYWPW